MSDLTIEQRVAAARLAGERGRHAEPMDTVRRGRAYRAQTGRPELTLKQRRRADKKFIAELKQVWQRGAAVSS